MRRGNQQYGYMGSILFITFALLSCSPDPGTFPYNLATPEQVIELPKHLKEISGLTYLGKNQLAGIQDEDGYIFLFDLKKGKEEEKIKFQKDGDYEGIAKAGKKIFILRSDGTLFKVKDVDTKKQETKKYNTHLNVDNDTEGLCYDKKHDRLLIACKDDPGEGKKLKGKRAIYAFDLKKKELKKKPVYKIDLKEVKHWLEERGEGVKNFQFKPSGIAVHPLTGEVYIIATAGKLLVVLNESGDIQHVHKLSSFMFKQPEGIAFTEKGDLLISNEGKWGKGNILRFKYQPTP